MARHRFAIGGSFITAVLGLIVCLWMTRKRNFNNKIGPQVENAFLFLQKQQELASQDGTGRTVPYITTQRLRGLLFVNDGINATNGQTWTESEKNVVFSRLRSRPNVRERNTEVRGEIMRVLEYIK